MGVPGSRLRGRHGGCQRTQQKNVAGSYILIKCYGAKACQGVKATHYGSSTPRTSWVSPGALADGSIVWGRAAGWGWCVGHWTRGTRFTRCNWRKLRGAPNKAGGCQGIQVCSVAQDIAGACVCVGVRVHVTERVGLCGCGGTCVCQCVCVCVQMYIYV